MFEQAIIVYYVVATVYLAFSMKWGLTDRVLTAMLIFLLPFLGLILSVLQIVALKSKSVESQRFINLIDGYDEHEGRIFERVDVTKGINLVPLEEALVVNDQLTRRRLLLDILKEDMDESMLPLLKQAINNDDTETSHYAVTAVMEIKRILLLSIQKWSVQYEEHSNDPIVILQYTEVVKQYITSEFLDKRTQLSYRVTYSKLLDQLLDSNLRSEVFFSEKINNEIILGQYDEAMRVSSLFLNNYSDNETAYMSALNLFYILKMNESFFETLEEFKRSKIRVSNSALNMIRYWSAKGA